MSKIVLLALVLLFYPTFYNGHIVKFFVISASFPKVPFDILSQLCRMSTRPADKNFKEATARNALRLDLSHVMPDRLAYVTVSTCNRFELYVSSEASTSGLPPAAQAHRLLARLHDLFVVCISLEEFIKLFDILVAEEAVTHLFETISGLRSAALGEREISRQIRKAYRTHHQAGRSDRLLNLLFQKAFSVSKEVASRTSFPQSGASLVNVALDAVNHPVEVALIIGTGAYAGAAVARLKERGLFQIYVHSPSDSSRARHFAASHAIHCCDSANVDSILESTDLVIGSSGNLASDLFSPERIKKIRDDSTGPVTFLDLALNNDFSAELSRLPGVYLVTLAEVTTLAWELSADARAEKKRPHQEARAIIDDACATFIHAYWGRNHQKKLSSLKRKLLGQGLSAAEVHRKILTLKNENNSSLRQ